MMGLSPRVRGSPDKIVSHEGYNGSIPAGAGEPSSLSGTTARAKVYPRGCGEPGTRGPNCG